MKALILVADGVEDMEFYYPYYRFKEQKIEIHISGPGSKHVSGKHGYEITIDEPLAALRVENYDIIILPGGKAPEKLRNHPAVIHLVKDAMDSGKIIASICHGAQILISANVLKGRKATCFSAIKDDIIAAGAKYLDQSVVVDGNLITSRHPHDLPEFCREIFSAVEQKITA